MMQIACHTWGFNDLRLPEALGTIARLGFRYVDIGSGVHLSLSRLASPQSRAELLAELQGDLAYYHLQVADVCLLLPRISIDDEHKRQTDIMLFKAALPILKGIGARGVTLSTGLVHPADDQPAYDRMLDALRQMRDMAVKVDLPISIEPHLDAMISTPEQALNVLAVIDGLMITLDWAQFVCQKIKPAEIEQLLPYTRHVQLRQAAPQKLQTPFAKGRIKFDEVLQTLHTSGYTGLISVEVLQTVDWHGSQKVSPVREVSQLRDAIRDARDAL